MACMETIEELTQIKELKELIISTSKAFYGPKHPGYDKYDVVISTDYHGGPGHIEVFRARVIVWAPGDRQWKCLAMVDSGFSRVEILENMLKKVERDFDDVIHQVEEGDFFRG